MKSPLIPQVDTFYVYKYVKFDPDYNPLASYPPNFIDD